MSPYGFKDHWERIEPVLTADPLPPKDIQVLCGLGKLVTELTLRTAAKAGLCGTKIVSTTTQRNRTPWSRVLYLKLTSHAGSGSVSKSQVLTFESCPKGGLK